MPAIQFATEKSYNTLTYAQLLQRKRGKRPQRRTTAEIASEKHTAPTLSNPSTPTPLTPALLSKPFSPPTSSPSTSSPSTSSPSTSSPSTSSPSTSSPSTSSPSTPLPPTPLSISSTVGLRASTPTPAPHTGEKQIPASSVLQKRKRASEDGRPRERATRVVRCSLCNGKNNVSECRDCLTILCSRCQLNAPFAHPFRDHHFDTVVSTRPTDEIPKPDTLVPSDPISTKGTEEVPSVDKGLVTGAQTEAEHNNEATGIRADGMDAEEAQDEVPLSSSAFFSCRFCSKRLSGSWFECRKCTGPEAYLCSTHAWLHQKLYPTHDPEVVSESSRGHCDGEQAETEERQEKAKDKANGAVTHVLDGPVAVEVDEHAFEGSVMEGEDGTDQDSDEAASSADAGFDTAADNIDSDRNSDDPEAESDSMEDDRDIEYIEEDDGELVTAEQVVTALAEASKAITAAAKAVALATDLVHQSAPIQSSAWVVPQPQQFALSQALLDFKVISGATGANIRQAGRRTSGTTRQWDPQQRRQLSNMKRRGMTDAQIGQRLGRSANAISQQWRKQRTF